MFYLMRVLLDGLQNIWLHEALFCLFTSGPLRGQGRHKVGRKGTAKALGVTLRSFSGSLSLPFVLQRELLVCKLPRADGWALGWPSSWADLTRECLCLLLTAKTERREALASG